MADQKKRILLIHRYFYPDSPPYAVMLEDIRRLLIESHYHVDILSTQPSYKSADKLKKKQYFTQINKYSKIIRLPNLLSFNKYTNLLLFPILVFWYLLFCRKYDVISVGAVPPVILAFFVALATKIRRSKLIYHCGDIHPESGRVTGDFKIKSLFNLLRSMDNITCRISSKIILLSNDMKNSLLERNNLFSNKIEILNNFDLGSPSSSNIQVNKNKKTRVIFSGNIGRFQNLHSFILALKNNKPLINFELVFMGEGSELRNLKQLAIGLEDMIRFIPHQSVTDARRMMSIADMGIVSLQKDIIKYAYPSKTMTYLSEGLPVLVSVGWESELSKFVESENLGISLKHSDQNHIYDVFKQISAGSLIFDRKHIKRVFENYFSKKQFSKKYKKIIFKVVNKK